MASEYSARSISGDLPVQFPRLRALRAFREGEKRKRSFPRQYFARQLATPSSEGAPSFAPFAKGGKRQRKMSREYLARSISGDLPVQFPRARILRAFREGEKRQR